jgi:hypothetical protein
LQQRISSLYTRLILLLLLLSVVLLLLLLSVVLLLLLLTCRCRSIWGCSSCATTAGRPTIPRAPPAAWA